MPLSHLQDQQQGRRRGIRPCCRKGAHPRWAGASETFEGEELATAVEERAETVSFSYYMSDPVGREESREEVIVVGE